jgi:cephalosporin hydroxylase
MYLTRSSCSFNPGGALDCRGLWDALGMIGRLPEPISLGLDSTLLDLWRARGVQAESDSYAGVPLAKFPEDLRVYEHLIWWTTATTVVELGAGEGGSALWFRDRLGALAAYRQPGRPPQVIAVDLDTSRAAERLGATDQAYADAITLIQGDVRDPEIAERIAGLIEPDTPTLVVDDSAHTYETTAAALRNYSALVAPGGFFVVEDGGVDVEEVRLDPDWPRGVLPAIADWLGTPQGQEFTMRRDLELYGITSHPQGFLQRRA